MQWLPIHNANEKIVATPFFESNKAQKYNLYAEASSCRAQKREPVEFYSVFHKKLFQKIQSETNHYFSNVTEKYF